MLLGVVKSVFIVDISLMKRLDAFHKHKLNAMRNFFFDTATGSLSNLRKKIKLVNFSTGCDN